MQAGPCEEEAVANEVEVTKASEQFYSALEQDDQRRRQCACRHLVA